MSISIDQLCSSISLCYDQIYGHFSIKLGRRCSDLKMVSFILCFFAVFAFLLLLKQGDLRLILDIRKKKQGFFLVFIGM